MAVLVPQLNTYCLERITYGYANIRISLGAPPAWILTFQGTELRGVLT